MAVVERSRALIVGAGPAGAALALLLARRGVRVTLLERHPDFAREFRGEALQPSGIDAFAQMGLLPKLELLPHIQIRAVELHQDGRRIARVQFSAAGFTGPRITPQPPVLELLVREAAQYPGFRFERAVTVRDLLAENGRVTGVRAVTAKGEQAFEADLVVGADGRTSVIRKRSNLDESRPHTGFDIVWAKVPLPEFLSDRATARADIAHGHAAIAYPSPDGHLQMGWVIQKGGFGELRRLGASGWIDEIAQRVSPDMGEHLRNHRAEIKAPVVLDVQCYQLSKWSQPGLLLIGDAAHPMSPVGGQGINLALRDALVAANRLSAALLDGDSQQIDERAGQVERERSPEVSAIQRAQTKQARFILEPGGLSGRLLYPFLPFLGRTGFLERAFRKSYRRYANGTVSVRLES